MNGQIKISCYLKSVFNVKKRNQRNSKQNERKEGKEEGRKNLSAEKRTDENCIHIIYTQNQEKTVSTK